jgi:hypothetical protein
MILKDIAGDPELKSDFPLRVALSEEFLYLMKINLCCQQPFPPLTGVSSCPE